MTPLNSHTSSISSLPLSLFASRLGGGSVSPTGGEKLGGLCVELLTINVSVLSTFFFFFCLFGTEQPATNAMSSQVPLGVCVASTNGSVMVTCYLCRLLADFSRLSVRMMDFSILHHRLVVAKYVIVAGDASRSPRDSISQTRALPLIFFYLRRQVDQ